MTTAITVTIVCFLTASAIVFRMLLVLFSQTMVGFACRTCEQLVEHEDDLCHGCASIRKWNDDWGHINLRDVTCRQCGWIDDTMKNELCSVCELANDRHYEGAI